MVGAVLLAAGWFLYRAVWRGLADSEDLTYGWSAAQAWLQGRNPYEFEVLKEIVLAKGGPVAPNAIGHGVYFPTSLPLFVPLAWADWTAAKVLGLALNVAGALFIGFGLGRFLGWRATSPAAMGLVAFVLALGPVHTTVSAAQTGVVATAAIVGAMLLEQARRGPAAGILYGLAVAAKVQMALPFLAYLVWRRRWSAVAAAGAVIAALTVVAVAGMEVAGVPWMESWLANLAWLSGPEGTGSVGSQNPDRISLINLQYPLFALFSDETRANVITLAVVGAAGLGTVWMIRSPRPSPRHELLAMAIVGVLSLMVTYHRYYDAVLVALPVAWGVSALGTAHARIGFVTLVLALDYVVPVLGALLEAEARGYVPAGLAESLAWRAFVLPVHAWVLVLLLLALLRAAWHAREGEREGGQEVSAPAPAG